MIRLSQVTKDYNDGTNALRDLTFVVDKGEFVFLGGESGAGKTSLLSLLCMQERPTAGTISVCGYNSDSIRPRDIPFLRRKLGIVFQDFKLLTDRTVFENVALALRVSGTKERVIKRKVFEVLAQTGLSLKTYCSPDRLSSGELQRVCIARAIVNDPWVLLADEPTRHLDPEIANELFRLLRTIHARGTTVVMATNDSHLIGPYGFRRIALSHGTISVDTSGAGAMH
jgi:cell division transport system ATP-binding protein